MFDLYGLKGSSKRVRSRPHTGNKRRSVRTCKRNISSGVRHLKQQVWVLDDAAYAEAATQQNTPPPLQISHILTDGVRVSVTCCGVGQPHAPGLDVLHKKGYSNITQELDLSEHYRGLFASVKPIPEDVMNILDMKHSRCFIEAVGVDPGEKELITYASSKVDSGTWAGSFKQNGGHKKSSAEYRYETLAKRAQRYEIERRADNPQFADAQAQYITQNASLKTAEGTPVYSDVLYQNLDVLQFEYMTIERRGAQFARHRAKERTVCRLARDLAGGDPDSAAHRNDLKPTVITEEHAAAQQRMREFLKSGSLNRSKSSRTWTRVVFFGNAVFGQGKRGPLPRKAMLKKLAEICCVVLTDEFRTSQRCCGCGEKLQQVKESRVFRCKSSSTGDNLHGCSVEFIDRDVNGAVNIGRCGVCSLQGADRPRYLCRPPPKKDDLISTE